MKNYNSSWKLVLILAILAGSTVVAGAGISGCKGKSGPAAKTLVIGSEANGTVVDISDLDTVSIKLRENASTGYQWIIASVDGKSVESIELPHEADPRQDTRPGSAGDYYADFRVIGSGRTNVVLEYRRPWEKDKPALETFHVAFDTIRFRSPAPAGPATTGIAN